MNKVSLIAAVLLASLIVGCAGSSFKRDPAKILRADAWDTACQITYRSEEPGKDHWQTPAETLMTGCGDCEDKAILLWYVLRHVHGVKSARLVVGVPHIVMCVHPHAWVEVGDGNDSIVMDPTFRQVFPRFMLNRMTFVQMRHKAIDIKANAFMDVTGYRNLNPAMGWK